MSPDLALNFTQYSLRPVPGGWVARCRTCDRAHTLPSVDPVLIWQRDHTCSTEAVAAVTRREAAAILARLPRDDFQLVLARREVWAA